MEQRRFVVPPRHPGGVKKAWTRLPSRLTATAWSWTTSQRSRGLARAEKLSSPDEVNTRATSFHSFISPASWATSPPKSAAGTWAGGWHPADPGSASSRQPVPG